MGRLRCSSLSNPKHSCACFPVTIQTNCFNFSLKSLDIQTFATFGTLVLVTLCSDDAIILIKLGTELKKTKYMPFTLDAARTTTRPTHWKRFSTQSLKGQENYWRILNMAGANVIKCSIRCFCPSSAGNTRVRFCRIANAFLRRQHTKPMKDDNVQDVCSAQFLIYLFCAARKFDLHKDCVTLALVKFTYSYYWFAGPFNWEYFGYLRERDFSVTISEYCIESNLGELMWVENFKFSASAWIVQW